jgi:hypothetical protein
MTMRLNALSTVAAVYDRRFYTRSDNESLSRVTLKPAVIDRRYSGNIS